MAEIATLLLVLVPWRPSTRLGFLSAALGLAFVAFGRIAGATREIGEGAAQSRDLLDRERAARKRLERVAQASLAVDEAIAALPSAGVAAVIETIAREARALLGAEFATVELENDVLAASSWGALPREHAAYAGVVPARPSVLRTRAGTRGFFRKNGLLDDSEFAALPGSIRVHSLLGMPLVFRGRVIGFVLAGNAAAGAFDESAEDTLRLFAGRAGIAVETTRLYQRASLEKSFLQTVIDEMPDGISLLDGHGRVLAHNRAARRLSRGDRDETDDAGNTVLFDAERPDGSAVSWRELPMMRAALAGERVIREELSLKTADGTQVPILASAVPIFDGGHGRVGAVAVLHDVTAIRELERMRKEWASVIAHDLRQPIGTIMLSVDLLRHRRLARTDGDAKALERMETSAARLSRMIDDLLDASRLDAGRLTLARRIVDLSMLASDAADRISEQTSALIRTSGATAALPVDADPGRLDQILCNLLSNAVKYGAPGAPISLELRLDGNMAEVAVTNFGSGIEPDELPRLFARFHRTARARRSATPGIGLGLYITRELVLAHGGQIDATSRPGDRTTFRFRLPIAEATMPGS